MVYFFSAESPASARPEAEQVNSPQNLASDSAANMFIKIEKGLIAPLLLFATDSLLFQFQ
ncbi:MAG: hypothetical protein ING84_08130 [Cytophagales bacterium]|nr:hypothetical protein [Cytophagales bacterium]